MGVINFVCAAACIAKRMKYSAFDNDFWQQTIEWNTLSYRFSFTKCSWKIRNQNVRMPDGRSPNFLAQSGPYSVPRERLVHLKFSLPPSQLSQPTKFIVDENHQSIKWKYIWQTNTHMIYRRGISHTWSVSYAILSSHLLCASYASCHHDGLWAFRVCVCFVFGGYIHLSQTNLCKTR